MDPELEAIDQILKVLQPLDEARKVQVMAYVSERLMVSGKPEGRAVPGSRSTRHRATRRTAAGKRSKDDTGPDIAGLVNDLKALSNFVHVESKVLDDPDYLGRTLVALAMYRRRHGELGGMTSGDIVKFYGQLGIKLGKPNVSTTLSGRAKQFVMTDMVRKRGAIMRYRLSRHGVKYVEEYGIEGQNA